MAKQTKESRFVKDLEGLGFTKIPIEISESVRQVLPRSERRRIRSGKLSPTFTASEIITYVTDEFGQSWQAPRNKSEELKKLSFIDHSNRVMSVIKERRQHDR